MSGPHEDQEKEITSLRKENRILREEREILKKRRSSSRGKNDALCIHKGLEEDLFHPPHVQSSEGDVTWLPCLGIAP